MITNYNRLPNRLQTSIYFTNSKYQLAEYLESEELDVGYYVVFSNQHGNDDTLNLNEIIKGKRIITLIVRVEFERPSDQKALTIEAES